MNVKKVTNKRKNLRTAVSAYIKFLYLRISSRVYLFFIHMYLYHS